MAEYAVTWRLVFDADNNDDARQRHLRLLDAQDDLDASIHVWGDGPQPVVQEEPARRRPPSRPVIQPQEGEQHDDHRH